MKTFLTAFGGLIVFGLVIISVCANFWFGTLLISAQERWLYGAIFALLDALKTVLIPVAGFAWAAGTFGKARTACFVFALLTVLSFSAEIGLYSISKSETVGDAKSQQAAYRDATAERDGYAAKLTALGQVRTIGAIDADISAKHLDRLYDRSRQCGDATAADSRELCQAIERLNAERATAIEAKGLQARLDAALLRLSKMGTAEAFKSVDPQAEALAKLSGLTPDSVRLLLAILIAAMIELGSGLGFWLMSIETAVKEKPAPALKAKKANAVVAVVSDDKPTEDDCIVERWVNDMLMRRRDAAVPSKDLRPMFKAWCDERGLIALNATQFGKAMTRLGYKSRKIGGIMRYEGIAIRGAKPALVAVG